MRCLNQPQKYKKMGTKKQALRNLSKSWRAAKKARAKIIDKVKRDYMKMIVKHTSKGYAAEMVAAKYGITPRTLARYVKGSYTENGVKKEY